MRPGRIVDKAKERLQGFKLLDGRKVFVRPGSPKLPQAWQIKLADVAEPTSDREFLQLSKQEPVLIECGLSQPPRFGVPFKLLTGVPDGDLLLL